MNSLLCIDDLIRNGSMNMAIDDLLGRRVLFADYNYILRTYFWEKPTLSCGFHQKLEKRINLKGCEKYGVEVTRRPTGGRELLHDGDMSFSITGKIGKSLDGNISADREFFLDAARVIVGGLEALGISAEIKSGEKKSSSTKEAPCLASISQYEIVCSAKKVVPMAQRVYSDTIMVHGSIPMVSSGIKITDLIRTNQPERLNQVIDESSTDLQRLLNAVVNVEQIKAGIKRSFESIFNGSVTYGSIPNEILELAKIESEKWQMNE